MPSLLSAFTPPDSYPLLNKIPKRYWPRILAGLTPNVPLGQYIQDAVDAAGGGNLYVHGHGAQYGIGPDEYIVIGTSGLSISGPTRAARSNTMPTFVSMADKIAHPTYGIAMFYFDTVNLTGCRYIRIDLGSTHADGMWLANCTNRGVFKSFEIAATRPANDWDRATAVDTAANKISVNGASRIPVGSSLQWWRRLDSSIPDELAENTTYYVVFNDGAKIQVSTTIGGSPVDLNSTGTFTFTNSWGWKRFNFSVESINTSTKTLTVRGHQMPAGTKVRLYNALGAGALGQTSYTQGGLVTYLSPSLWVLSTGDPDTLQLAATPGGPAVALNNNVAGQMIARENCGQRGGGNQYFIWEDCFFNKVGTARLLNVNEAPGGVYVGCDTITDIATLLYSSCDSISGRGIMNVRYEGPVVAPNFAASTYGPDLSIISDVSIYYEIAAGPVEYFSAIANLANIGTTGNGHVSAAAASQIGGTAILARGAGIDSGSVADGFIASWEYSYRSVTSNTVPTPTGEHFFRFLPFRQHAIGKGAKLWDPQIVFGAALSHYLAHRPNQGVEVGGAWYWTYRVKDLAATSIDTRQGPIFDYRGNVTPYRVDTLVDTPAAVLAATGIAGGCFGAVNYHWSNDGLATWGTSAYETLSGTDFTPPAATGYVAIANSTGTKLRLLQQPGTTVKTFNSSTQNGSLAAADLFEVEPYPGEFKSTWWLDIVTPATAGTLLVELLANDRVARTIPLAAAVDATSSGPGFQQGVIVFKTKVGGGKPQVRVTYAGAGAGPLAYVLYGAISKDS